jgi:catechol 2,3-dioxygenase-like lactoylglutathione lyase family enzyme
MHLAHLILRVRSPEQLARFYVDHVGMQARSEGEGVILGFPGQDVEIELRKAVGSGGYRHERGDRYWKIGVTLPNVDIAYEQLSKAGIAVSEPRQFGDIGYMCHLADPEGFSIELLQHRFEANRGAGEGDPALPLGGGGRIGQVTLRTADLEADLAFYREKLGMTLLSIQPVTAYGFDLYFLAFTEERPPDPDLKAVGNREWLWQRPYTTLELQHVTGAKRAFALPKEEEIGFAGLAVTGPDQAATCLQDGAGGRVNLISQSLSGIVGEQPQP